jgi:hypothetical protein
VITAATRRLVRQRADGRCEFCRLRQIDEPFATYQLEHIIPKQHGGLDDDTNLALACGFCNRHKGPNLAGLDPADGALVALFNPRTQTWDDHFELVGANVQGRTACGRTTIRVLDMNDPERVALRATAQAADAE